MRFIKIFRQSAAAAFLLMSAATMASEPALSRSSDSEASSAKLQRSTGHSTRESAGYNPEYRQSYERAVLSELNLLREHPADYVASLRQFRSEFRNNIVMLPYARYDLATVEGVRPVNEAITFLGRQSDRGGLDPSQQLSIGARDLVAEQSQTGGTGHHGTDGSGPGERVQRHGGGVYVSEVITYGADSPRAVIRQLLVDDGVPDRGHRKALFDDQVHYAGISCGHHPVYRTVCVIDLASTPDGSLRGESHSHFLSLANNDGESPYSGF